MAAARIKSSKRTTMPAHTTRTVPPAIQGGSNRIRLSQFAAAIVCVWTLLVFVAADACAQRLNWQSDLAVSQANGKQTLHLNENTVNCASDGNNGAFFVWMSTQRGEPANHIYAAHVLASGALADCWTVCDVVDSQINPLVVSDGNHGCIVVWDDHRNYKYRVYARHLPENSLLPCQDASTPRSDGILVCKGAAGDSKRLGCIVSDGAHGALVFWVDNRLGNDDIYAQHLDATGTPTPWPDDQPVCTAPGGQGYYMSAVEDGTGGAFVSWTDRRNASPDIYAQHVDASGAPLWRSSPTSLPLEGVPVCVVAGEQSYSAIAGDGSGGALIAWKDGRSGPAIHAAEVKPQPNGTASPQADNTVSSDIGTGRPLILGTTSGALVVWEGAGSDSRDVLAIAIDHSAIPASTGALRLTSTKKREACMDDRLAMTTDGSDGAIVTWADFEDDIVAQRIDVTGSPKWSEAFSVCSQRETKGSPVIVSDGVGGALVAWEDARNRCDRMDIFAQRIQQIPAPTTPRFSMGLCTPRFDPAETVIQVPVGGGSYQIDVALHSLCHQCWTAFAKPGPNAPSIVLDAPGAIYTGSASVSFAVTANTTSTPLSGTLVIDGHEFTVAQEGMAAEEQPDPIVLICVHVKTADAENAGTDANIQLSFVTTSNVATITLPDLPNNNDNESGDEEFYQVVAPPGLSNTNVQRVLLVNDMTGNQPGWKVEWVEIFATGWSGRCYRVVEQLPNVNAWLDNDERGAFVFLPLATHIPMVRTSQPDCICSK